MRLQRLWAAVWGPLKTQDFQAFAAVLSVVAALIGFFFWLTDSNFLATIGLTAAIFVFVAVIVAGALFWRQFSKAKAELQLARREYDGTIRAFGSVAGRVLDWRTPTWRFERVTEITTMEPDGTCVVERRFDIEAGVSATHVWRLVIEADDSAAPVRYVGEIDLSISCEDGRDDHDIGYLVGSNNLRRKEIAVFFMPNIKEGEKRRVRVRYQWPGFARDLVTKNSTRFFIDYASFDLEDTAEVIFLYRFNSAVGPVTLNYDEQPQSGMTRRHYEEGKYQCFEFKHDKWRTSGTTFSVTATITTPKD